MVLCQSTSKGDLNRAKGGQSRQDAEDATADFPEAGGNLPAFLQALIDTRA